MKPMKTRTQPKKERTADSAFDAAPKKPEALQPPKPRSVRPNLTREEGIAHIRALLFKASAVERPRSCRAASTQADTKPVPEATTSDLDPGILKALLDRARLMKPARYAQVSDEEALTRLGALTAFEGRTVPSVAGLLAAGTDPQQFFPAFCIDVRVFQGAFSEEENRQTSEQCIKECIIKGPAAAMVKEAVSRVTAHTNLFPAEAVKELVANAVHHRDYSEWARNIPISIRLFDNALQVRNPGGLCPGLEPRPLFESNPPIVRAWRNRVLSRLMEFMPYEDDFLVHNRGTGWPLVRRELQAVGFGFPAVVENPPDFFGITLADLS